MNKIYESELNNSLLTFVHSLVALDPEMNEMGTIINQKIIPHQGDFLYSAVIMSINNIIEKLMECYNILSNTAGGINLCVQRLRNAPESRSLNSFIEDYPRHIRDFSDLVKDHVIYVKSIKQSIIDWNGEYKTPVQIKNTVMTIFDYVNTLEGSAGFYNKITNSINGYLDIND